MPEIRAAQNVKTNAELIARSVAPLYFRDDDVILDPTWGKGNWWTEYTPKHLIKHDLHTLDGVDFTQLPEADDSVDVVAFDPPYVCKGGRETSGIKAFDRAYGLANAPKSPAELRDLIFDGMTEAQRVSRRLVLVKCMNYISSGRLVDARTGIVSFGTISRGMELVDEFIHISGVRPQPPGRRQVHARRNYSYLLVFEVPRLTSQGRV